MFSLRKVYGTSVYSSVVMILIIFIILFYQFALAQGLISDFMCVDFYHHEIMQKIDGWSISHLLFFMFLGYLFPGEHLQYFMLGTIWEVLECALSGSPLDQWSQDMGLSVGADKHFWYGKESDIIMNMLGYTIGSSISSRYWPND